MSRKKRTRATQGPPNVRRLNWPQLFPLLVLCGVLMVRLYDPHPTLALRNFAFDSFERVAPRDYRDAHVRVVDIDDESLSRLGQWPWPRTQVARLLDRLAELGAAAIALDIVFAEPDRSSPRTALAAWREQVPGLLPEVDAQTLPDYDDALAQTIAKTPTVLGIVLTHRPSSLPRHAAPVFPQNRSVTKFLNPFEGSIDNLRPFQAKARGIGVLNADPDVDGTVRRVPLVFQIASPTAKTVAQTLYPALSAEALRVATNQHRFLVKGSENDGVNGVVIGEAFVPTDAAGALQLYDTGDVPQRTIPAWKILDPAFDRSKIEGMIVFVGTSAAGLADLKTTPLRQLVPGVEVHAQIAEQILLADLLVRPNWTTAAELAWMMLLSLVMLWLLRNVGPSWAALVGLFGIVLSLSVSWVAFRRFGILIDPIYPSAAALAIYLSQSLLQYIRTERERRFIRDAMGLYVSPAQVALLAKDPSRLRLGGEMRAMSILFCDIRGFTSLSETMSAEALTHFINSFLTPMTDIIQEKWRGTVDKYIGDCIMAFWNAPLDEEDYAQLAVRAAIEMMRALDRLNEGWRAEAEAEGRRFSGIGIGIGIATGLCCVGNLGSKQKLNYSVLGDEVNLASRLEGQTKTYGVSIIINEATQHLLPRFATLEIDLLRVKGKIEARRIFAVFGDEEMAAQDWFTALAADHDAMLASYRGQRWADAAALVDLLKATAPPEMQALYDLYAARIAQFRIEPPPRDWDGVMVAETK
jgi:adenylate cyclase